MFSINGATGSAVNFTYNGGNSAPINTISSGFAAADITADDAFLGSNNADNYSMVTGDDIELTAGSFTTADNTSAAPADGIYDLFVVDGNGVKVAGSAIPEPSTYAALAGGLIFGAVLIRRRKRNV